MQTLSAEHCIYAFDAEMTAACWVEPGEVLRVEMRDALDGQITEGLSSMDGVDQENVNPATGPIAVRGATPGQTLAVDVLDIRVAPCGYVTVGERPRFFEQRAGLVHFDDGIRLPMQPMIGTIGVAPREGRFSNKLPGDWGGNMDVRDVRAGATVYFAVHQPGGLLALGDVHSVQADGESSGQGVETQSEATLRVRLVDEVLSDWPVIFCDGELMTVAAGETLDEAGARSVEALARIVAARTRLDELGARILLGLAGDVRIGQMVCAQRTVRVALPVALLAWERPLPL